MTEWINSWKDFERICRTIGVTTDDMKQRGRRFLAYYKTICCTPEHLLPEQPYGTGIVAREQYYNRIEQLFESGCGELNQKTIRDDISVDLIRETFETALVELKKLDRYGDDYFKIICSKYTGINRETDQMIIDRTMISETRFYVRLKEASAYMAFYIWKIYLPDQRKKLEVMKKEAALQPEVVRYA